MKCECGETLYEGAVLTHYNNEIDYAECEACGIREIMGKEVDDE